jgi:hypothetical protein
VLFVTGDRVSITGGVLIHFDNEFLLCYEKCIDDIYESALKWAYEAESEDDILIDEIKAAVAKASVSLDFETFMKHFYLWKELTRDKHFPLPSCEWILPMQDAFWNVTKHGSDVKMQACQSMSATIPVDTLGAKAYNRMQMNVFANKGCQMFLVDEDLSTYSDLEHFCNAASHQLTFLRKCMIKISKIFLELANTNDTTAPVRAVVTPRQP